MADDAAAPEGELTESSEKELTDPPEETSESPQEVDVLTTAATDDRKSDIASAADGVEADEVVDIDDVEINEVEPKTPMSHVTLATLVGLGLVVVLAALVGWLGWQARDSHRADQQRELFVQVGKQAALNLTTIDFAQADKDVQRILDSATDTFYDDFSKRSQPFVDVVKQAQSKSVGDVTAAGLESQEGDQAQVLVAVTVKTSNAGAPEQAPRAWRMRILVKKTGDDEAKVSNVEFVP